MAFGSRRFGSADEIMATTGPRQSMLVATAGASTVVVPGDPGRIDLASVLGLLGRGWRARFA